MLLSTDGVNVVLELSDVGYHLCCEGRSSTW
jgi:hypothetical protein